MLTMVRLASLRFFVIGFALAWGIALSGGLVSRVSAADRWTSFRGDGTSLTDAKNLPLNWSNEENVAWSADLPGYGQSSPVICAGRVFTTSVQGAMKDTLIVVATDLATGKQMWQQTFKGTQGVEDNGYVSKAAPTPSVDDKLVYTFFESGDVIALTHEGKLAWQRSLTKEYGNFQGNHGVGASLAQTPEHVIVLIDHDGPGYLVALDKATGKNAWKVDRPRRVSWTSPVVVARGNRHEILLSSTGIVESYHASTGKQLWYVEGLKGNTVAAPTATKECVIIGGGSPESSMAIRFGGRGDVADTQVVWRAEQATTSFGSPLVIGDVAYFVSKPGVVFAVDVATGKDLWSHRLPDSCWASPIGADGRAYFFTKGGRTVVIKAGADAGSAKEATVLAENALAVEGRVYGVAAVEGAFVIRTGGKLTCVGKAGSRDK